MYDFVGRKISGNFEAYNQWHEDEGTQKVTHKRVKYAKDNNE